MLKKVMPFLLIVALVFAVSCNCGDSDEEPTPEPTLECNTYYWFDDTTTECAQKEFCGAFMYQGLRTFETLAECEEALAAMVTPEPTEEPTPTTSPTPTTPAEPDAVETVLASIMPNLIVAIAEANGEWQAYSKIDTPELTTLWQGAAYYFFSSEQVDLTSQLTLTQGWNQEPRAWMTTTAPIETALAGFQDAIIAVVGFDNKTKKWNLYITPTAGELASIPVGQTYYIFTADPDNPLSVSLATMTR